MKRALLASYEKDEHLLYLARLLQKHGWSLWGSAGTAKYLNQEGIACEDIASAAGRPILGHRVVTLSRRVHASLLARPEDSEELELLGIRPIGLVYVTLYPLEAEIANPDSTPEEILEKTDIGGPTLLRAAAKGRRFALSSPDQIPLIESWLKSGSLENEREALTLRLAAAAERRVADYVDASARYWESKVQ